MLVSDFDYDLPDERIAKFPPAVRGATRLLVLDKSTGQITDSFYQNLDTFLHPGDLLILNDTKVMPSRLFTVLPDGRPRELIVLENHHTDAQTVMYRGKLHEGDILTIVKHNPVTNKHNYELENRNHDAKNHNHESINHNHDANNHNQDIKKHNLEAENHNLTTEKLKVVKITGGGIAEIVSASHTPLATLATKYGTVPLPPYLHRPADKNDKERYQTVWAKHTGSAAAPTASLNMTTELLNRLRHKGVNIATITLHVGLGTFLPIRTENLEDHHMHSEWYHIPESTITAIQAAKNSRHRVIALGTTVARTLEYYAKTNQPTGEDDIFIYPGFQFQLVDALLTNFHAPKSTVLMLASAFAGWDHLKPAYDHAVKAGYNFLSYGDSMFIC